MRLSKQFLISFILISLIIVSTNFFLESVQALSQPTSALNVSPAEVNFKLTKNQSTIVYYLLITNNSSQLVNISLADSNIQALGNSGQIQFINNNQPDNHSLIKNIRLPLNISDLVINANSSLKLPITLYNLNNLNPGSYYAAIQVSLGHSLPSTGNVVGLVNKVDSLVFVSSNTTGSIELSLNQPQIGKLLTSMPTNLNLVFNNLSNIIVQPTGYLQLYQAKQLIYQKIINPGSAIILANSSRLIPVNLPYTASPLFFNSYKFIIHYHPLGVTSYKSLTIQFLVVNKLVVILSILIILVLIVILSRFLLKKVNLIN